MKTTRALPFICLFILACYLNAPGQGRTKQEQTREPTIFPFSSSVTDKIGFIDQTGKVLIKPQFEYLGRFSEGLAAVRMDGKYGYIDTRGDLVIKPQFDSAYRFSEGLALIELKGSNGYIDKQGNVVIKPQFSRYGLEPSDQSFSEGLALVTAQPQPGYRGGLAYINKRGDIVIKLGIDRSYGNGARRFHEGLAVLQINEKSGYIDKHGHQVIKLQYDWAQDFSEGLASVEVSSKWGYIDKHGNEVIKPQYNSAREFHKGLARVTINKEINGKSVYLTGYIDNRGNEVIKPQFDRAEDFSEGLAVVARKDKDGHKYGYIDEQGRTVIDLEFTNAAPFSEGVAAVMIGGQYGEGGKYAYIDKKGNQVIKPQFKEAGQFFNGLALVITESSVDITDAPDKSTAIKRKTKYGYVNKNGEMVFTANGIKVAHEKGGQGASGPPSFSTPLAQINIETIPSGAKIYLIPLDDWDTDEKLISNETKLLNYLLSVYSPLSNETVIEQVYMAIVESNGKRIKRVFDVNQSHKNEMKIDFNKEK